MAGHWFSMLLANYCFSFNREGADNLIFFKSTLMEELSEIAGSASTRNAVLKYGGLAPKQMRRFVTHVVAGENENAFLFYTKLRCTRNPVGTQIWSRAVYR